jgi:hypothetical protein
MASHSCVVIVIEGEKGVCHNIDRALHMQEITAKAYYSSTIVTANQSASRFPHQCYDLAFLEALVDEE